jgi:hypothetical protein
LSNKLISFSCTLAVSVSLPAGPIMRVTQLGRYTTCRGTPRAAACCCAAAVLLLLLGALTGEAPLGM